MVGKIRYLIVGFALCAISYTLAETVLLSVDLYDIAEVQTQERNVDGGYKKFTPTIKSGMPQSFEQIDIYVLPGEKVDLYSVSLSDDYLKGYSRWYKWVDNVDDTTQYKWVQKHLSFESEHPISNKKNYKDEQPGVYDKGFIIKNGGVGYVVYYADTANFGNAQGIIDTVGWDFVSYNMNGKDSIPPLSLQRQYIVRNAQSRYEAIKRKKDLYDGFMQAEGNSFRPWNHRECFLENYEIHMPSNNELWASLRLAEELANYYVSVDGDKNQRHSNCPTQVRWRIYAESGDSYLEEKIKTHVYDYADNVPPLIAYANIWRVNIGKYSKGNRAKFYVTAEATKGDDIWFPLSLLTIWTELHAEPHTQAELEELAKDTKLDENTRSIYVQRLQDTIDKTLYLLNKIDFDGGDIFDTKPRPEQNYSTTPVVNSKERGVALPTYAFGNLYRYDNNERPIGSRTLGRGEYALYRTLNVPGISDGGCGYKDYWAKGEYYPVLAYDRTYVENKRKNNSEKYGCFFYVDAAQEAGLIATLPIEKELCPNTRIIVTAWILNLLYKIEGTASADVAFTFNGITKDGTRVVLNKFYSGDTKVVPSHSEAKAHPNQLSAEWQQLYFWFDFSEDMLKYEGYELEVASNCYNSNGADFAIDDICIYRSVPNVKVVRTGKCNTSDILVNATYDDLLANFGLDSGEVVIPETDVDLLHGKSRYLRFGLEENEANIYVAILNEDKHWINGLSYNGQHSQVKQYARIVFPTDSSKIESIAASKPGELELMIDSISKKRNYKALADYKKWYSEQEDKSGLPDTAGLTPIKMFNELKIPPIQTVYHTKGQRASEIHLMNIRHYPGDTELRQGNTYTIFLHSSLVLNEINVDDPCALTQKFTIEKYVNISTDGESTINEGMCLNGNLNIKSQLNNTKGEEIPKSICGFDWYLGAFDETNHRCYIDEIVKLTNGTVLSLENALSHFHEKLAEQIKKIPDDSQFASLDSWKPVSKDDSLVWNFLDTLVQDGLLLLNKYDFNYQLAHLENYLVAIPFLKDPNYSEHEFLCLSPEEFKIATSAKTPDAWIGIPGLIYPDSEFNPAIRVGIEQVEEIKQNGLMISLRRVDFQESDADSLGFSQMVDDEGGNIKFDRIELYETNDPKSNMNIFEEVGRLDSIHFVRGDSKGCVVVSLFENFKPKEGYYYTLVAPYQEFQKGNEVTPATCTGMLKLKFKIVPEYLTFSGSNSVFPNEWNNDANWYRSSEAELYMGQRRDGYDAKSGLMGDRNDLNAAFAPLYFSKVTITDRVSPELYDLNNTYFSQSEVPSLNTNDNIVYDLVVDNIDTSEVNNCMTLMTYTANACNEIYFKPGAIFQGAQFLVYDTARVELEMKNMQPYWLSSPLFSVVAGDFYAPEYESMNGRQQTPAFEPIIYNKNTPNYRFNPAFYQRAWEKTVNVYLSDGGIDTFAMQAASWSVDYNDLYVPYEPGWGFYARVEMGDLSRTESALVRLPKNDGTYKYEHLRNNLSQISDRMKSMVKSYSRSGDEAINRSKSGRMVSDLPKYSIDFSAGGEKKFLFLGNPYMSYLDVDKFFSENESTILPRMWSIENGAPTLVNSTNDSWIQAGNVTGSIKIAPMQAFFVEIREGVESGSIVFTPDMTVDSATPIDNYESANQLVIRLTGDDNIISEAVVLKSDDFTDGYNSDEDAAVFCDIEPGATSPVIYTASSGRALAVNSLTSCKNVPIGVFNANDESLTLTISGISSWDGNLMLYDAVADFAIPLNSDSYTFEIQSGSNGRYFLKELNLDKGRNNGALVYTPSEGIAVVAATEPISSIYVYTTDGINCKQVVGNGSSSCTIALSRGFYILKVNMQSVVETHKLFVP